jgi:hypothetical protein
MSTTVGKGVDAPVGGVIDGCVGDGDSTCVAMNGVSGDTCVGVGTGVGSGGPAVAVGGCQVGVTNVAFAGRPESSLTKAQRELDSSSVTKRRFSCIQMECSGQQR